MRILELRAVLNWCSCQFKSNHFTEMCCGTETGSYLRLIDSRITQLKAQGPSRTCNQSKEEDMCQWGFYTCMRQGVLLLDVGGGGRGEALGLGMACMGLEHEGWQ